jgi:hypothetical protein
MDFIRSTVSYFVTPTAPKNTIHDDKAMSSDKRINKRVPGFDTFYSLNEPQIGSAFSSVC